MGCWNPVPALAWRMGHSGCPTGPVEGRRAPGVRDQFSDQDDRAKDVRIPPGRRHQAARTTLMVNFKARVRCRRCGTYTDVDRLDLVPMEVQGSGVVPPPLRRGAYRLSQGSVKGPL